MASPPRRNPDDFDRTKGGSKRVLFAWVETELLEGIARQARKEQVPQREIVERALRLVLVDRLDTT